MNSRSGRETEPQCPGILQHQDFREGEPSAATFALVQGGEC